jgi:autotransporter translocation and assembly factor TamB
MHGQLKANKIDLQTLPIDGLEADLSYADGALGLKDLRITVGGNKLIGNVALNIPKQTFKALIDIPKPLHLPYLGKRIKTIDTAGDLSGRVQLEGTGLMIRESRGKGSFDFSHRFSASPDFPVEVRGPFQWANGAIDLKETAIVVGNDAISAEGRIDIPRKRMSFSGKGEKFPIEALFDKFRNPHLQKIFGRTDFEGSFEGWGKNFTAKVTGMTFDGGFKPIVGERVSTELEATYNTLDFAWGIFQGERQTGTADLSIKLGPKVEGAIRSKSIDLKGKLSGHDLSPSFPGFNLTGTADGEIELAGPHTNFKGKASAAVLDGSWLHVPIDFIRADADLTRYKLTFNNIELTPKSVEKQTFIAPLVMDLSTGKFRLHGTPLAGLDIDLGYTYEPKRVRIDNISYAPPAKPGERISVAGSLTVGGAVSLNAKGQFDLSILNPVKALIREASGPASLDLRISGTSLSPAFNGTLAFGGNAISPRPIRLSMEQLNGKLRFEGYRVHFDGVAGLMDEGSFTLEGWIEHRGFKLANSHLLLNGSELGFRTADNSFRMTFDGDLTLKGPFPQPMLAGDVNILDGRYTKDFVILEQLGGKSRAGPDQEELPAFNPRLDLKIQNSGDLLIRNNVGDIDLKADIVVKGTRAKPEISGAVNAREGRINYMGLNFDIDRGFVEFRGPYAKPYLEVEASRELRLYNLTLLMYGYTDNLSLDLEGTSPSGPLEKRDVVSLLAFGITEQERRETEAARTGSEMGISVAAQQVGQMLERPITSATHLDIFRIESAEEDTDSDEPGKVATRLRVGKQLTDRLSVDFSTDIDTKDAEQTVTTEYLITDTLLIKGSRSSNAKYEGNIGLRFRLR